MSDAGPAPLQPGPGAAPGRSGTPAATPAAAAEAGAGFVPPGPPAIPVLAARAQPADVTAPGESAPGESACEDGAPEDCADGDVDGGADGAMNAQHASACVEEATRWGPALARVLRGPTGLGTTDLHPAQRENPPAHGTATPQGPPAEGDPIPGLYHHPVPEPDPVRVEEVSRRIKAWAVDEVQAVPPEWEDQFDGFSVSRYMVACHPDAPTVDHVMVAARLMVAENAVDDCYCEDHGGSPVGLGSRLLLAHTALDPLHTTAEYEPPWGRSLHSDAPRRAYRSAMEYLLQQATPSQADRFRHDMARLHLGYLAEAAWAQEEEVPEVWEYLAMRQFNNFRPCPTITDTVGGYELPADLHARPEMQRVLALGCNATTIVNDLYSYTKELKSPGLHLNLPVVLAVREELSERDAYLKAVEVHNELMHAFEAEAAALAAACPVPSVLRFLRGVAAWIDGNHHWHQTNTYRYSLPDFWSERTAQ